MKERFSRHHTSIALPTAKALQLSLLLQQNLQHPAPSTTNINTPESNHLITSSKYCPPSATFIGSPRFFSSVNFQKTSTERDFKGITKNNRNFLPVQHEKEQLKFRSGKIPSASRVSQTRINFTYNKPNFSQFSHPSSKDLHFDSSHLIKTARPHTSLQPNKKSKLQKKQSSKLCSDLFNISYSPIEESSKKNRSQTSLSKSRQSNTCLKPYQSKITAAQTTVSAMGGIKDSDIVQLFQNFSKSGTQLSPNKDSNNPTQKQKRYSFALIDQLAPSKRLDKTVMLPHNGYDFGGLLPDVNKQIQQQMQEQYNPFKNSSDSFKGWNQFRGLLTQESSTDLKESIHCGPDMRASHYVCTALQGFGREIKQSCVGFQD